MQPQSAQVVGHASLRQRGYLFTEQFGEGLPQVAVREAPGLQAKQQKAVEERLHALVCEAQGRGALVVYGERTLSTLECLFAYQRLS